MALEDAAVGLALEVAVVAVAVAAAFAAVLLAEEEEGVASSLAGDNASVDFELSLRTRTFLTFSAGQPIAIRWAGVKKRRPEEKRIMKQMWFKIL